MADSNDLPPPEPARPLSDEEKAVLARLEADVSHDSSSGSCASEVPWRRRAGPRPRTLLVQVVVVVALAVVLSPSAWAGAVIAAVVLSGPLAVSVWAMRRRSTRHAGPGRTS